MSSVAILCWIVLLNSLDNFIADCYLEFFLLHLVIQGDTYSFVPLPPPGNPFGQDALDRFFAGFLSCDPYLTLGKIQASFNHWAVMDHRAEALSRPYPQSQACFCSLEFLVYSPVMLSQERDRHSAL